MALSEKVQETLAKAASTQRPTYEVVCRLLERAAADFDEGDQHPQIITARFTIAQLYERPFDEVEQALQARLKITQEPIARARMAGAAAAQYPALAPYHDDAVTQVEALNDSPTKAEALQHAANVRRTIAQRRRELPLTSPQ